MLEGRFLAQLGEPIAEPRFRVEDPALSVKTVIREGALQEKVGPSVASEVSALLPTIGGDPGAGAQGALVVSERWPDLTIHLDGAVAWTRAHRPGVFLGTILEVHDAWTVRPVGEVFVAAERDAPTAVSGLMGAIWRVRDALSLDARPAPGARRRREHDRGPGRADLGLRRGGAEMRWRMAAALRRNP